VKALDRFLQSWRIRKALPFIRSGDRLLDVGCYDWSLIDRVLSRISSAVGIDTNVSPSREDRVEILQGHFPDAPLFDAASFDCISMLAVLEHVGDPAALATECERILDPGGRLILTVPHPMVDLILDALMFFHLVDGMAAEEHHGFDVEQTRSLFETARLSLRRESRFQLGLIWLYVFEKPQSPGIVGE
jgi:SAM-dependent methyltransferase